MNERLTLRPQPTDSFLSELEQESIALFHAIKENIVPGSWEPSPVEDKYLRLREVLLTTPGVLRGFRHSFLAAGRLNFPDSPRPKEHYLQWDNSLAGQEWAGALHLLKMAIRMYCHQPFKLEDLNDRLVGQPTTYRIPKSVNGVLPAIGRRLFKLTNLKKPRVFHFTEAQIRFLYYRRQISSFLGNSFGSILEIGAGYGGLVAELLEHLSIGRYFILELPESVPLVYFYLRAMFDYRIQVLYCPDDKIDPKAQIVILAPWKLPDLEGEIDLLINTVSFQHMFAESIKYYLNQANRLKTKYLYLVNRDTKRDPTDLPILQYPIPNCYTAVYKKAWLWGPHVLEIIYKRMSRENGEKVVLTF